LKQSLVHSLVNRKPWQYQDAQYELKKNSIGINAQHGLTSIKLSVTHVIGKERS